MRPDTNRLRIVVLGYIVRGPLGGLAWHHLQYVLGLTQLGHDVFFIEDSDDYPSCYDPRRNAMDRDPSYGLDFAHRAFTRLGLGTRWGYYDVQLGWLGPASAAAVDVCRSADVLLNLSGVNPVRSWMEHAPVRVLVDTDPAFTQIRHLTNPSAHARAALHTAFLTYGENIGRPGCSIPDDGFPWRQTRQPVVLDAWQPTRGPDAGPLTTVMLWDSYPSADFNGVHYGMKAESFGPYIDLPLLSRNTTFQLALGAPRKPREHLEQHGWLVIDSREPTSDPWTYQAFIRQSKAEFSVAKHGYVASRSGWFSERSAGYLASGRPVVVQDTGFSDWLDTEGGVLPFRNTAEALAALDAVTADYEQQCRWARAVAEKYFDSAHVLSQLLDAAVAASTDTAAAAASTDTAAAAEVRRGP